MHESRFFQQANLLQPTNDNHRAQFERMMQQIGRTLEEAEALSLVFETSVQELDQPMRAVLCWSQLLLSETDPDTPLATGLGIIVKEANRMNEIVRGLNLLNEEETQNYERTTGSF
jgi:signal transduction histidine kinase